MSFNVRTLIVCDTNSLRNTEAGEVAYSSFSFGKIYQSIEDFIKENSLQEFVELAVPKIVIEELKRQKQRSYNDDIAKLKSIYKRLTGLPHISADELNVPDESFNCADFVENEAQKYVSENNVSLLDLQTSDAPVILNNLLNKVVGYDKPRRPFFITGSGDKIKDAGFKDSVIWETLMHFGGVANFDKVIFVSKDNGFNDCKSEFQDKWEKHFELAISDEAVKVILRTDYGNYIENRKVYEYANKDYYKDYLFDLLKNASTIDYEGESLKIENFHFEKYCRAVDQMPDEDGDFIGVKFVSDITVDTTFEGQKINIPVSATTALSDLDYMEIEETVFDPNIS